MKKIIVAIYIRVSTKKQVEEGYSLDAQLDILQKFCENNGYMIYKVYADEGKSGKDTNRPAFQEMMTDLKNGAFNKILVTKLDRISRSLIDLETLIKDLQKNSCDFESASEKIDTNSAMGLMFIRLLGIFAQFERERISERIFDAFETMVNENKPISGSQPMGYKIEDGAVVIDKEKEPMIREIFDMYERNHNLRKTVLYINEKYKTTLKYHNVLNAIQNTMFYGAYRNNLNYCPAYMSKERWDNINNIRKNGRLVKECWTGHTYLFSKLLVDTNCNCKLVGKNVKGIHKPTYYYSCNKNRINKQCISNTTVNEAWLEKYLLDNLDTYINKYFDSLDKEYKKTGNKDNTKEIAALKEELRRTTLSFNKGRMEEIDYDKEWIRINNKIKKLESEPVVKDTSHLKSLMSIDWKSMYKELLKENKSIFWRNIIDKIEIDPLNYKKGGKYIKVILL